MGQVTVLTSSGRGAVTTIRLRGIAVLDDPTPLWQAANDRPIEQQPIGQICFGRWGMDSPEEVVVCRTGPDIVEIHCHGGVAAGERILADLSRRGCQRDTWQVSAPNSLEIIEAECREALTRATTLRTADILWQQCQGRLASVFAELERLPVDQAQPRAAELLRWADFGRHLSVPWRVVLCGRPNVGKSSLLNALVGFGRSIVYDQPGTTRDVVTVETALDGWPLELADTAGIRDETDELESTGIRFARERLDQADLCVLLIDTSRPASEADQRLLAEWPDALLVAHKSDLPIAWGKTLSAGAIPVSSRTGAGLDELTDALVARLIGEVPPPLTPIPVTPRQVELLDQLVGNAKSVIPAQAGIQQ